MKLNPLTLHGRLVAMFSLVVTISLAVTINAGQLKPIAEREWLDIIGEGGIVLITVMWIYVTLISRPAGQVTNWLIIGLTGLHVSVLLDLLDEFFTYPEQFGWLSVIEPLPAPIGMVLMSIGLYFWHQEQLALNEQLKGRERYYREHHFADNITSLYSADYMVQQISHEFNQSQPTAFSLLMLDLDNFDAFVRQHGDLQGDRLLRELAELILMNIRTTDVACRYAGDRFILLLPETELAQAEQLAEQIEQAVAHLSFKPEQDLEGFYHSVSISACESQQGATVEQLLLQLNSGMEKIKLAKQDSHAA